MGRIRREALREHIEIIKALKSGNPEQCRKAMVEHVRRASERTIALREDEIHASHSEEDV